jgi:hypothetical protein
MLLNRLVEISETVNFEVVVGVHVDIRLVEDLRCLISFLIVSHC